MLFVDDVWVKVHLEGVDRVTRARNDRNLNDFVRFYNDQAPQLGTTPCVVLDRLVEDGWFQLARAGRTAEARSYGRWMKARGLSRRCVIQRRLLSKARRSLRYRVDPVRSVG